MEREEKIYIYKIPTSHNNSKNKWPDSSPNRAPLLHCGLGTESKRPHNSSASQWLSYCFSQFSSVTQFSSVQSLSHIWLFETPWIAARQASLSITISQSSFRTRPSSRWCHTAISSSVVPFSSCPWSLPASESSPMSQLFAWGWPKYWSFSFSIIPSKEHPELISFRMDWLDLLAVQGTLKSLLQHHSSKASILRHSAFFTVQLLHPYMITGKTIALTRWTFVGKVMFLLFNMLSRLVITFLPRSKRLLILWLQSPSAVILEPKNKSGHKVPNSNLLLFYGLLLIYKFSKT